MYYRPQHTQPQFLVYSLSAILRFYIEKHFTYLKRNIWKAIYRYCRIFPFLSAASIVISLLCNLATIEKSDLFAILDLTPDPQWHRQCHFLHCQRKVPFSWRHTRSTSLLCAPVTGTLLASALPPSVWHHGCKNALLHRPKRLSGLGLVAQSSGHRNSGPYKETSPELRELLREGTECSEMWGQHCKMRQTYSVSKHP